MSNYKESHYLAIRDYIDGGCKGELTPEQKDYESLLFTTAGLFRREERETTIKWLKEQRGCSRHVASRIIDECANLYYATDNIRQDAWRNLIFEKLLTVARLWEKTNIGIDEETNQPFCRANAKDYEAYTKILKQAAAVKQLSKKPDTPAPTINNNLFAIFTNNPRLADIPPANKGNIMQNEYIQGLPKKEQERLGMEAGITKFDFSKALDYSTEIAEEVNGG